MTFGVEDVVVLRLHRACLAAFVSVALCLDFPVGAAFAAPPAGPNARASQGINRRVDLRSLPVHAPPVKATRRDHQRFTAAFRAPESTRQPPYRSRHDRDQLSMRLARGHSPGVPTRTGGGRAPGKPPRHASPVSGSGPGTTGKYPWWSFEGHTAFSAMGQAQVNVANGNLVLVATDLAMPHFGLDLVVARAYNSTSQYDVLGTDGSQPSIFGNGWTSNLDVHIAVNAVGGITVYDAVGTRWDYTPNADGGWIRPPGQMASLWYSASNQEYYWTLKDGLTYQFRAPTGCSVPALCGRIHYIYARNNNAYLHFSYGFSSPDYSFASMSSITVATETNQNLYLYMNPINGHPLVTSVVPNGQSNSQVRYDYDNTGNMTLFTGATNNDAGTVPTTGYGYFPGGSQLQYVTSPLYGNGHGAYLGLLYAAGAVSEVDLYGEVNPSSFDGVTSGPIQNGPQGVVRYNATQYTYGAAGWTNVIDSDGHQRSYQPNTDGSVGTRSTYSGSQYLSTSTAWDLATHNLTSATDPRGATTDFAYDDRGNMIMEALPAVSVYAGGSHAGTTTMRPTFRYVFDPLDNVVASCGPAWNHAHGSDFGGGNSCGVGAAGVTSFTWQWTETEPQTRLLSMIDPSGYQYTWSYDPSAQGGVDYSLPSEITGTTFMQPNSGTSVTPDQKFSYDAYGNLACYNDGVGITAFSYDALNRLTFMSDPDDRTAACGRPTGQYQTALYKSYLPNGQVKTIGGSVSHAIGQDTTYTYDLDGNGVTSTEYPGNQPGVTRKYFDGADRLIEVVLPHTTPSDPVQDVLSTPWLTRYVFDNSGGAAQTENGINGAFYAYGNLYKVQELQPSGMADLRVASYDAANRQLATYSHVPGRGAGVWRTVTNTYDTTALGKVGSTVDSGGNSKLFAYDTLGRVVSLQFGSVQTPTPSRGYGYDEEGRLVLTRSGTWGDEWSTYDPYTGRLQSKTEPNQGGLTSPGVFSYAYFPNGWSRSSSFNGGPVNGMLHDQWYNVDGTTAGQNLYNGSGTLLSVITSTFTAGKRLTRRGDSQAPNATVTTLDAYGRTQSIAMRAGTYSQMTYDTAGNVTSFNAMSGHSVASAFNERGELASSVWTTGGTIDKAYPNMRQHGRNGVMEHDIYGCTSGPCTWGSTGEIIDMLAGAVTSSDISTPDNDYFATYGFDNIGRQTTNSQDFAGNRGLTYTGLSTKTYDAEDRLTSDNYRNWGQSSGFCGRTSRTATPKISDRTLFYDWGSNGHPVRFRDSSRGSSETLHWEGDSLAFTTNAAGQLDDLKFGTLADYTPLDASYQGLTFWDRDPFGAIASAHNGTGFGTWTASSASHGACTIAGVPVDSAGYVGPTSFGWVAGSATYRYQSNGLLLAYSGDGLNDGFNNTNGIRTLSGQTSAWTVPDPFGGVPESPQSQKAYVYAANNPASEGDSSGYIPTGMQDKLAAYLNSYDFAHAARTDWDCTTFIVHAYAQALHIDIHSMVAEDYAPGQHGYELHGMGGHPEYRVQNLHNYFDRMHELHAWDGYVNKQVGDVIWFKQVHSEYSGEDGHEIVWTELNVHVITVAAVNSKGDVLMIAEGTQKSAVLLTLEEFKRRAEKQGYKPQDWGRIERAIKLYQLYKGSGRAVAFMGGGDPYGWLSPSYDSLRYY